MIEKKRDIYEQELVNAVKKHRWVKFGHIDWSVLSFKRSTGYLYQLDKSETVKEAFAQNRVKAVNYMLWKWIESDNPTLQIAAMRIIADDEDRIKLNQQYTDITSKGQSIGVVIKAQTTTEAEELTNLANDLESNAN